MFEVDPAYAKLDVMNSKMVKDIWYNKYRWGDEKTIEESFTRVAKAVYPGNESGYAQEAIEAMKAGLWIPGGRILAGAGTPKRVTLMNCYVNATVEDSMEGIMDAYANTMFTLQQGGGIGTDFSPLRPAGALLKRTHTKASGPMPFMHMWDAGSRTIRSAGDRRGAMMGTMSDTHPDLPSFIIAKRTKGALEQFNISVLVSDAFMEAVKEDNTWLLYHTCEPYERDPAMIEHDFEMDGVKQYVYSVHEARDLWKLITENTYEWSEPGVIFIDRVNDLNNLHYIEDIRCTNPCGEQPLPPHGTCNLGHINLAKCVRAPFSPAARIDHDLIRAITRMGVRFLDNVIDLTAYPLDEQAHEEYTKRRLGLGYTGLADLLAQIGVRYGSPDAVRITEEITRTIAIESYRASIALAQEKGAFALFDKDKYLSGFSFVNTIIPEDIRQHISEHGIRNALLNTIAPVGTGSIVLGNVSSSCEPVFLHRTKRRVLKPTTGFGDQWEEYIEYGFGALLYRSLNPGLPENGDELPAHMVTADDLTVEEHLAMQAAAQRWVDSSISKTINVPRETSYNDFIKVYDLAYTLGCKGCTTYRPSDVRGSVLSDPNAVATPTSGTTTKLAERPAALQGRTYKIGWPSLTSAIYLTINQDEEGKPYEIFLNSKDAKYHDWTTALSVMITAIYRNGGDTSFVARELQQIQSLHDGHFKDGQRHPSLIAYIGFILDRHLNFEEALAKEYNLPANILFAKVAEPVKVGIIQSLAQKCPECHETTLYRMEGCNKCSTCNYTSCG